MGGHAWATGTPGHCHERGRAGHLGPGEEVRAGTGSAQGGCEGEGGPSSPVHTVARTRITLLGQGALLCTGGTRAIRTKSHNCPLKCRLRREVGGGWSFISSLASKLLPLFWEQISPFIVSTVGKCVSNSGDVAFSWLARNATASPGQWEVSSLLPLPRKAGHPRFAKRIECRGKVCLQKDGDETEASKTSQSERG